jgi:hypothetical protein
MSVHDRSLQSLLADTPSRSIGLIECHSWIGCYQRSCFDIGVVERSPCRFEARAADTAFARAVGACENGDGGN